MVKSKLFTFINIFGMSVSLACCIMLFQYATNELTFDLHHGADIYRLTSELSQKDGEVFRTATSSVPIAYTIIDEIPEIENTARATGSRALHQEAQRAPKPPLEGRQDAQG